MVKTIFNLLIVCIGITIISCERKAEKNLTVEISDKIVKTILESIHDPIENSGKVDYSSKISEQSSMTTSVFNRKGALISKSIFNSMGNLERKVTLKFDEGDNNVEMNYYSSNGLQSGKRINKFDDMNKLIESNEFDANGKIISKQTTVVNSDGNKVTITYILINGSFVKTLESILNKNEHNSENYYFTDNTLVRRDTSKYDGNGNRVETIQYDLLKNEKTIAQYKYDNRNNNIELMVLNNNLMITSKVISTYDDRNNVVETLTYGMLGSLTKRVNHTYEYDDALNWTKDITFVNRKPVYVTLHRIEYY
ncbi:MAG: hypothetical protein AABY93_11010 [Bacteroidota bacterium]